MSRQRGFSALLMLALIVLMGGMLAYAASMTSSMSASAAQELAQERVRQAALTGLEWGRYRIESNPPVGVDSILVPFTTGNILVTVRRVQTSVTPFTDGGAPYNTYLITATACSPAPTGACPDATNSPDYVERQVTGVVAR